MSPGSGRDLLGFAHRLTYATLLALLTWLLSWLPVSTQLAGSAIVSAVLKVVNFPVALASQAMPLTWRGLDLVFAERLPHTVATSEFLLRHLRVAIPVYVFLFYLPNLLRSGLDGLRRRRTAPSNSRPLERRA